MAATGILPENMERLVASQPWEGMVQFSPASVHDDGLLLDILGIVLGLAGVDHEHDVAVFLVDGDFQVLDGLLAFLGHPFAGLDELFVGNGHLVAEIDVALVDSHQPVGADILGAHALAGNLDHHGDVDAEGAILGAAAARGAAAPGDLLGSLQEFPGDFALLVHDFAQGLADLVLGHELGILVIGQVEEAGLRAHAAGGAGLQPGAQAGRIVSFQDVADFLGVHGRILGHGEPPTRSWCRGGRIRCQCWRGSGRTGTREPTW